jgi:hypothetical protein
MIRLNLLFKTFVMTFGIIVLGSCNSQSTKNASEIQEEEKTKTNFEEQSELKSEPKSVEQIGTGRITTKVDGMDVMKVKLWSSASSNRTIVCYLTHNEEVKILRDADPYFLVESFNDSNCKGYCMKGFVIKK